MSNVTFVTSEEIMATIPQGLAVGTYDNGCFHGALDRDSSGR